MADVAHDPCEIIEQGLKAVNRAAVVEDAGVDFAQGGFGTLGGGDRVPEGFGGLILVGEQQRTPRLDHVPLDVVGEHAEEDVRPDAVVPIVADGPDLEAEGFERTKRALDLSERLVTADRIGGADPLGRKTGADDVDSVQGGFGGDLLRVDGELEVSVADVEREVFAEAPPVFLDTD